MGDDCSLCCSRSKPNMMECVWHKTMGECLYSLVRKVNQNLKLLRRQCVQDLFKLWLSFYCIDSCFLYYWAEVMPSFTFLTPFKLQIVGINSDFFLYSLVLSLSAQNCSVNPCSSKVFLNGSCVFSPLNAKRRK